MDLEEFLIINWVENHMRRWRSRSSRIRLTYLTWLYQRITSRAHASTLAGNSHDPAPGRPRYVVTVTESAADQLMRLAHPPGRIWLCLVAGEDRAFGGHDGYDDDPSSRYVSDHTIPNTRRMRAGDVIVVWDKRRALGVSVIDRIDEYPTIKTRYHCRACNSTSIKARRHRQPLYRCQQRGCGAEFDLPLVSRNEVQAYSTYHEPAWRSIEEPISARELRALCESPESQHSIRELNASRVMLRMGALIDRSARLSRTDFGWGSNPGGHKHSAVRVTVGQGTSGTT